jgi:hypothetical protein
MTPSEEASPVRAASLSCPHCGAVLRRFRIPEQSGWQQPFQWACFNNDCPYYREGWEWMWEHYRAKASYRYRLLDPLTGQTSPLAVWSETALLERILDDEEKA